MCVSLCVQLYSMWSLVLCISRWTIFHHVSSWQRGEWKAQSIFWNQTADCFFYEQSFSPSYVKCADIQLYRVEETKIGTDSRDVYLFICLFCSFRFSCGEKQKYTCMLSKSILSCTDHRLAPVKLHGEKRMCSYADMSDLNHSCFYYVVAHESSPLSLLLFCFSWFVFHPSALREYRWPQMW